MDPPSPCNVSPLGIQPAPLTPNTYLNSKSVAYASRVMARRHRGQPPSIRLGGDLVHSIMRAVVLSGILSRRVCSMSASSPSSTRWNSPRNLPGGPGRRTRIETRRKVTSVRYRGLHLCQVLQALWPSRFRCISCESCLVPSAE